MNKVLVLMPNRISKTLSPEKQARIKELLQLVALELGETTQIPEAEHKKLARLGEKNIILYDLLKGVMNKYPEYINSDLLIEELTKDRSYFGDLETVKADIKKIVLDIIEHEQDIAGAEYRNGIAVFEDNVAIKVARRDPKALLAQDEIDKAYKEYDRLIAAMQDSSTSKKTKEAAKAQ